MTQHEFLKAMSERGAKFAPPAPPGQINIANLNLQKLRAAMLPTFMINLYQSCSGIKLNNGYIFGPLEVKYGNQYPVPNIIRINQEISNLPLMRGRTLFGRNDLFWFAFDSFGNCTMLDNLELKVLRKYDDPYRAMLDCLIGGKI